jgi:hypothetical protein
LQLFIRPSSILRDEGVITNLILHCNTLWRSQGEKYLLNVLALLQSKEPYQAAYNYHDDAVD